MQTKIKKSKQNKILNKLRKKAYITIINMKEKKIHEKTFFEIHEKNILLHKLL